MTLLSPKIDLVFKKLFTSNGSDGILRDFLASVLEIEPESIGDIEIQNGEILPDAIDQKYSVLDLAMKVGGRLVNVEMQVNKYNDYPERTLFYTCKRLTGDLKEGDSYAKLKPTIAINIVDFKLFDCEDCHSRFAVREINRNELLTDKLRIDFLELPKADTDKNVQVRKLKRWLNFFNMKTEEDAEMLERTNDNVMKQAVFILREMSADEKMRERARIREMALHDEASAIETAEERGKEIGKEIGETIGEEKTDLRSIRALMDRMGLDAEQAMDLLGIAEEKREKYAKEL